MTTIPGASQYLAASTYANATGQSAQPTTLLSNSSVDILEVARGNAPDDAPGISKTARALNKQFLSSSSGTYNTLFSASAESSTTENLQTQILGMRASLPSSSIDESVPDFGRGETVDTEA